MNSGNGVKKGRSGERKCDAEYERLAKVPNGGTYI
jgi:hypothetical protein